MTDKDLELAFYWLAVTDCDRVTVAQHFGLYEEELVRELNAYWTKLQQRIRKEDV